MTTRIWLTTTMTATMTIIAAVGCVSDSTGDTAAYIDDGWDAATDTPTTAFGGTGGTGGWWDERAADVHWSVSFDGTPTDLLRTSVKNLVAGHRDGIATVWSVEGERGAREIWSSAEMGTDAKLIRGDEGGVRVVALAPGGFAFAPIDGASEPVFVPLPAESPRLIGAVPGEGEELWVALEVAPWEPGEVLRVAGDGTIVATHRMRDLDTMVGVLRQEGRTVVYGNAGDGDDWEKCIPDDGNTALSSIGIGLRVTGAWVDGSRAMLGFDIGGASCATEIDCQPNDDDDDMEELAMPMPVQKTGPWSYGHDGSQLLMAFEGDGSIEIYGFDLEGADLVAVEGNPGGLAVAVLGEGDRTRVVEVSQ